MTEALERSILAKVIIALQSAALSRDVSVGLETRFAEDLGLSRLDMAEVGARIETAFGTSTSQEMIAHFRVVPDMVHHISRQFFQDVAEQDLAGIALAEAA